MKEIKQKTRIDAVVEIPGSKSLTHRAVIASALARGESVLTGAVLCEDTIHTAGALCSMGAKIERDGNLLRVQGMGGRFSLPPGGIHLFLGNSGTSLRLLLSIAALGTGTIYFSGTKRLCERPVEELVGALRSMGVNFFFSGLAGHLPLVLLSKGLRGGRVSLDAGTSSQFLSSLLMAGPYAAEDTEICLKGTAISRPYVNMTLDVMEAFGVPVYRPGKEVYRIKAGKPYMPRNYRIEGDASSASYFWAAAAVTGGRVVTKNLSPDRTTQGDMGLLNILEQMGCSVRMSADGVEVQGGPLRGISVDMGDLPDMVPTLAAVAIFANGMTEIRNVGHLRHKESDRLAAIKSEWARLGCRVHETDSGVAIHGGGKLHGALVDPREDHRIAMSMAVAGLRIPGITIQGPQCVGKSFPGFWDKWDRL